MASSMVMPLSTVVSLMLHVCVLLHSLLLCYCACHHCACHHQSVITEFTLEGSETCIYGPLQTMLQIEHCCMCLHVSFCCLLLTAFSHWTKVLIHRGLLTASVLNRCTRQSFQLLPCRDTQNVTRCSPCVLCWSLNILYCLLADVLAS